MIKPPLLAVQSISGVSFLSARSSSFSSRRSNFLPIISTVIKVARVKIPSIWFDTSMRLFYSYAVRG